MYQTAYQNDGFNALRLYCSKRNPACLCYDSKPAKLHQARCNISKTSASVSSGVPNTEKRMKARGRRPSAFIVSRCLEPLMKHEARVFGIAS